MKWLKGLGNHFIKEEKGNILILVALFLVVLLGFAALAVDVGELYLVRRQMVNAVDSAALAGAQQLIYDRDNVEEVAKNYAIDIGGADDDSFFDVVVDENAGTVAVEAGKTVAANFARFIETDESYVSYRAKAKISPLAKGIGLAPFTVVYSEYKEGEVITIKYDKHQEGDISDGNYHFLDLEGGNLRQVLAEGSDQEVSIGDYISTQTGTVASVRKEIQDKFDDCGKGTGDHWDDTDGKCDCGKVCDRRIYIVLFDELKLKHGETGDPKPGKTEVRVAGIAAVYLLKEPEQPWGQYKEIEARFIKTVGQFKGGDTGDSYGVYKVHLIE